jgi:hypothetical protein
VLYIYTQNLVKNSWLRLRRDFLPDLKNSLIIHEEYSKEINV